MVYICGVYWSSIFLIKGYNAVKVINSGDICSLIWVIVEMNCIVVYYGCFYNIKGNVLYLYLKKRNSPSWTIN